MKMALIKTVLASKKPSVRKLERAFMEEFGAPPPLPLVNAFIKKLPSKYRPGPALKAVSFKINLIRKNVEKILEKKWTQQFEARGGQIVRLPMEKGILDILEPLKAVYGIETTGELVTMALKILEQQARTISPEIFETKNNN